MSGRSDRRAKGAKMKEETLRAQGAWAERRDAVAGHCGAGEGSVYGWNKAQAQMNTLDNSLLLYVTLVLTIV